MQQQINRIIQLLNQNRMVLWVVIILITLLWGYAWVVMKQALQYMGPLTFSSFRFATGALAMIIVVWLTKQQIPLKKYWKKLFIQGLLQTTFVFTLVMFSLQFVGAGKASV